MVFRFKKQNMVAPLGILLLSLYSVLAHSESEVRILNENSNSYENQNLVKDSFWLRAGGGYYYAGGRDEIPTPDSGEYGQVTFGYHPRDYISLSVGLQFSDQNAEETGEELDVGFYSVLGHYHFDPGESSLVPEVFLGLGVLDFVSDDNTDNTETEFAPIFGGGLVYYFDPYLSVYTNARVAIDAARGGEDLLVGAGIQLAFNKDRSPSPPPPAPEPPPPPPVATPTPIDLDLDRVPDDSDYCPKTPPNTKVDEYGCPWEPGLLKRFFVDDVHFAFDKSYIRGDAANLLAYFSGVIGELEYEQVLIIGHTDSVGTVEYNQALSERRADSVARYLVSEGLDPNKLETLGYGETRPIASNETAESRARNRRVEVTVWDYKKLKRPAMLQLSESVQSVEATETR